MQGTISDIDRLAALQDVDRQIKAHQDLLNSLRAEIDDFQLRLTQQRTELTALRAEYDALELQRAEMEKKLEGEEARIRDSRMKLNRVRNDRELMAMRREIEVTKEANKLLEEQLITIMEGLEAISARMTSTQESLQALEGQAETEIADRNQRSEGLNQEIAVIRVRRDEVAKDVAKPLRTKYEQIFARRNGTAVVEVRGGTCLGCHMHVPPQLFNELIKFRDVRQCPNCHRILYVQPSDPPAASAAPRS